MKTVMSGRYRQFSFLLNALATVWIIELPSVEVSCVKICIYQKKKKGVKICIFGEQNK